jgi:hypothetical protein
VIGVLGAGQLGRMLALAEATARRALRVPGSAAGAPRAGRRTDCLTLRIAGGARGNLACRRRDLRVREASPTKPAPKRSSAASRCRCVPRRKPARGSRSAEREDALSKARNRNREVRGRSPTTRSLDGRRSHRRPAGRSEDRGASVRRKVSASSVICGSRRCLAGTRRGCLDPESFVEFTRELSIIAVRATDGQIAYYPLVENHHSEAFCG